MCYSHLRFQGFCVSKEKMLVKKETVVVAQRPASSIVPKNIVDSEDLVQTVK